MTQSKWMKDKPVVKFSIVTAKETSDWTYGRRLFEMLIEADSRLTPQKIGNEENLKKYESIASFEPYWGQRVQLNGPLGSVESIWPVSWQRNSELSSTGQIDFRRPAKDGTVIYGKLHITAAFDEKTQWLNFFRNTCEMVEATAGFLHIPAETEIHKTTPGYSPYYVPLGGTIQKKQLSNIAWATFFGPPFAEETNFHKLAELGYHVEELAGGYLLLMSDNIMDCFNDFPTFSGRRVELKKHFRPDLFRITEEAGE